MSYFDDVSTITDDAPLQLFEIKQLGDLDGVEVLCQQALLRSPARCH